MTMTTEQRTRLDWCAENIVELLPHGSGIDTDWLLWGRLRNRNVVCICSYHGMDEHGSYDGWQDFKVVLHPIPYVTICPACDGKKWRSITEIAKRRKCKVKDIDKTSLALIWVNPNKTKFQCRCVNDGYNPKILDFRLSFRGYRQRRRWIYGLRECLEDTIQYSIGSYLLLNAGDK